MYEAHFGLKKSLFGGGIAQEEGVFLGPRQQLIAANFKVALTTLDSAVVMIGPAGVGKTTLTAAALRATTTRLALGWLTTTPANAHELLELLLAEFGFNPHRVGRVERLQMWRQFLNEMAATNSRAVVIAECAEELPQEMLRALDALTASDATGSPGANLVLLGHAGLDEHLKAPRLDSLRQRVRLRQRLDPFALEEFDEYLKHRVRVAGGDYDRMFAPDAAAALHELSGGVLRVANNLCETALTIAATRREPRLDALLLQRVATNLFGLESQAAPTEPSRTAPTKPHPAAAPVAPEARTPSSAPLPAATARPAPAPAAVQSPVSEAVSGPTGLEAGSASAPPPGSAPPPATMAAGADVITDDAETHTDLDVIEDDDFAVDTITDAPEVPMADFPVLTDAVDEASEDALAEDILLQQVTAAAASAPTPPPAVSAQPQGGAPPRASSRAPAPRTTSATPTAERAVSAPPTPPPPVTASPAPPPSSPPAAPKPTAPAARAAATQAPPSKAPSSPPAASAKPTASEVATNEAKRRALSTAKSIDDISNSMAETLFGDADLDMLSAALASAGWSDDQEQPTKPAGNVEPAPPLEDDYDIFGFSSAETLELVDDEDEPAAAPKRATQR